ncbi:hypothetical protein A3K88_04005 [Pseudomonas putida]|nr:hypothetical protein A3K88_04005 [Pseudomonas putida]
MLHGGFVIGSEARLACGERYGIGMRLELGPAGEAGFAGHQPLGIGKAIMGARQAKGAQLFPGVVGLVVLQGVEQTLGAFAQSGKIEQAMVAGCMDGGHANSFEARSADKPGAGMETGYRMARVTPLRGPQAQPAPGLDFNRIAAWLANPGFPCRARQRMRCQAPRGLLGEAPLAGNICSVTAHKHA